MVIATPKHLPGGSGSGTGSNQGATIGVAAAGVVTELFIVVLWRIYPGEKYAAAAEEASTHHISALSHVNNSRDEKYTTRWKARPQQHRCHV